MITEKRLLQDYLTLTFFSRRSDGLTVNSDGGGFGSPFNILCLYGPYVRILHQCRET